MAQVKVLIALSFIKRTPLYKPFILVLTHFH